MTNKFLLNLLGFNPDLTTRQSRVDSVSSSCRFRVLITLLLCMTVGVGQMRGAGTTVTYAQSSSSAASVSSGTAPTGSTVTFSNSYSTKDQVTNGNSMALTLTGYKGYKITAIKLSMHSNAKQGSGTFSAVAGTTTLASISSNTGFNAWYDNTSYGTSYRDVNVTMTNSTYEIKKDEDVVITITCPSGKSNNSLYCQSFTITYEAAGGGCSNAVALSKGTATNGTVNTISSASVATCSATASDRRVTVTITPAACYDAPTNLTWTKSSGTVTASKQSGPTDNGDGTYSYVYQFAQNDNGAGTFGVTCTAKAAGKTVNFDAGPGVSASSSLTETCDGSGVTLPTVTASGVCKGWTTFAGWATAPVTDSTTTSGVTLYAAGSNFVPSSNGQTLYAVYSKVKGSAATWNKVTTLAGITAGTYVIVSDGCALQNTEATSSPARDASNYGVTITDNKITSTVTDAMKWSFTGTNDEMTIKSYANSSHYLFNTGSNSNTGVRVGATADTWTFEENTSAPAFAMYDATKSRYCCSTISTYNDWRSYNSADAANYRDDGKIYLFKQSGGSTTYYCSDPNCCTPLGSINGSFKWSKELEDIESPNSFNIYLVYFSMSKINLNRF